MRKWIIEKLKRNGRFGVINGRPNKTAKGITAGLYAETQKLKKQRAFTLSESATLAIYGTLDSLRNYSRLFFRLERQICACCGQHTAPKLAGLSNVGKNRLKRLRNERNARINGGN